VLVKYCSDAWLRQYIVGSISIQPFRMYPNLDIVFVYLLFKFIMSNIIIVIVIGVDNFFSGFKSSVYSIKEMKGDVGRKEKLHKI